MGIMVKIYGAQFKLKSAFDLITLFKQLEIKPSLIFFTNLIHVSFYNKKPGKAELAFTLMKKEDIKGDKLMFSKLIEGLLRFKQTARIPEYIQRTIDDGCTLRSELIDQLSEIYEDEPVTMELIEKVKISGVLISEKAEMKNRLKNNYHQTNTQNFKNKIWQMHREKQEEEKRQQHAKEKEFQVTENPEKRVFGGYNKKDKKSEYQTFKPQVNSSFGQSGQKQPMVLHNFRTNKKVE